VRRQLCCSASKERKRRANATATVPVQQRCVTLGIEAPTPRTGRTRGEDPCHAIAGAKGAFNHPGVKLPTTPPEIRTLGAELGQR
jgi:hypothetical protein